MNPPSLPETASLPALTRRCCAWLLAGALGMVALTSQAEPLALREHHRWTNADDDGPNQVGALAQTTDGYLWLDSDDGLLRSKSMAG